MNPSSKNRLLVGLVILLLIANAATIAMFWIGRAKRPPAPRGEVKDFLVKELNLDSNQQIKFEQLRNEHRHAVDSLREKVKQAKDAMFELVKDPAATDSIKHTAAEAVGIITEEIDLYTVEHFQKLRAICNPEQQKRFDELLHQVTSMMAPPPPPKHPDHPGGPPPDGPPGPEDPGGQKPPPPPKQK
jgi:Spy/CpxP family protein refolding chaperone